MNEQLMQDPNIKTFVEAIQSLKEIDEDLLTDEATEQIIANIENSFSGGQTQQAINQIVQNLEAQGSTREEAKEAIQVMKELINELVYGEEIIAGNKRKMVDKVIGAVESILDTAYEKYHSYAIELPIKLDEGAQVPTYAHETDACADMYAMEDVEIPAHFKSAPVKTGVHIQLPEGWVAMLFPRSSIGAKTSLRLSNSIGIIDSKQEASQWAA